MHFMEIVDLLFITSYFVITILFVTLILSKEIRGFPHQFRTWFFNRRFRKEISEDDDSAYHLQEPERKAERRKKALDYLVKNYFDMKKREEEYAKKIENYGTIKRWIYRKSINFKNNFTFVASTIVQPSIMILMVYSTALSLYLGMRIGPYIADFIRNFVPQPFNYILDVLIIFPIGFSPGILSIVLGYYLEKKRLERMLREYGVEI